MPRSEFIHLHLHTQYSLLDGACRLPELFTLAKQYKMNSLAITDHGNMFGAIEFYIEAQKAGIKPIIGCEVYLAPNSRWEKSGRGIEEASYHFILLARDEEGYRNLMQLVSIGYLEGFYYRPRIDKQALSEHAKGLIGLSSCIKGEIPYLLQENRFNDALKVADEFNQILGKDNFYLELQENGLTEQKTANQGLLKIAKQLSLPIVATNDVHYLSRDKAKAHEALLCIQTQTTLSDPNRMRFKTNEFYFRSPQEMKALFKDNIEAINNTLEIADRCNLELDFSRVHLPHYKTPEGKDKDEFLKELCLAGLNKRFQEITPQITQRLEQELKIIKERGFVSYFLIVWDFVHYAKMRNIPIGPGRGSAAGSLVSYLLGITDINPLKYGLLFERFLNPQRQGLPDIDIDFCYERRQEVIDYVTQKYGRENVAQIITFGTLQARAVIRDVGRVMGLSYAEVDRIAKMVPPEPDIRLKEAIEAQTQLKDLYKNDSTVTQLIDTAMALEGLNRHASIHAAGVVIADSSLTDYTPLFKGADERISTGYSMQALEKIGLLKVDFLGLRTLTVIEQATRLIKERKGKTIDIENLPLDDAKTFRLLSNASSSGVFQLESAGMRDLLKKLAPERFEDLIAILALYRPGPMGSGLLSDFIQRKHRHSSIKYDHKKLEPILSQTYGIMVYQEQVMQIASELAGFSLAQADLLRRAMSKKIPEVMERERKNFLTGCLKNNITESTANKIFDFIEYFSGYGFNKSHSAAYALISYRTAYLKANFPVEFMAALLTSEKDNTDKVVEYINEANRMGIKVLPPDINESFADFTVADDKTIRFGLRAVKNVGLGAIDSIVLSRRKKGRFDSLGDLCQRVDLRLVNRKVLESLIKCGALDSLGLRRAAMMAMLDGVLEFGSQMQRQRQKGQLTFFDLDNSDNGFRRLGSQHNNLMIKEWPQSQLLAFEKEMLGFYISGHPLARYSQQLRRFSRVSTQTLSQHQDGDTINIVGLLAKIKQTLTRQKQERMAILKLEDLYGVLEVLVFPQTYARVYRNLQPNSIALVKGRLNLKEDTPKLIANDLIPFDKIYSLISAIKIDLSGIRQNIFETLREKIAASPGKVPVYLHFNSSAKSRIQIVVGEQFFVEPTQFLIQEIEALLGDERISIGIEGL
jgi:DNA polymerase-3 subunit alpha